MSHLARGPVRSTGIDSKANAARRRRFGSPNGCGSSEAAA